MTEQIDPQVLEWYRPVKKIGSGAYGHVWKVVHKQSGVVKALKKNFDAFTNATDAQRTYREVMFLKQLKHSNIIVLEDIIRARNDKDIYLVFEHMDIDLHTLIRENTQEQHLQEKHKQYIVYQIAKAIYFLHNSNIIHRDLKPSNILINENCDAKLCDFGLVRSLEENQSFDSAIMTEYIATRWYRAPELLLGCRDYSKEVDIWALGCLMGELFRGKAMFPGTSTANQVEKLLAWTGAPSSVELKSMQTNINKAMLQMLSSRKRSNRHDFFPERINPQCMDLISRMLQFVPGKRIKIQQVLKHEYLSSFYNEQDIKQIKSARVHIQLQISDNTKQSLRNYREMIYSQIKPKSSVLGQVNHPTKNNICTTQKNCKTEERVTKTIENENVKSKQHRVNSRLKTQSIEQVQNNMATVTYESVMGKVNQIKQSKNSLGKKNTSKARGSSMRKKGISLCSKDLGPSNSLSKKKYSEPSSEICEDQGKYSTGLNNTTYKRMKAMSRSCNDKYDKNKKPSVTDKRKIAFTGYFVNDNIGRKELGGEPCIG